LIKGSLKKVLERLSSGDVVCVEWCEALVAKSCIRRSLDVC